MDFVRGYEAHHVKEALWKCRCGKQMRSGPETTKMRCEQCNRWMEWEPIELKGEGVMVND